MLNFWKNILRYPYFFISSTFGLITLLFSSLQELVPTNKPVEFLVFSVIFIATIIIVVLINIVNF